MSTRDWILTFGFGFLMLVSSLTGNRCECTNKHFSEVASPENRNKFTLQPGITHIFIIDKHYGGRFKQPLIWEGGKPYVKTNGSVNLGDVLPNGKLVGVWEGDRWEPL